MMERLKCGECGRPACNDDDVKRLEDGVIDEEEQESLCWIDEPDCIDERCSWLYAQRLDRALKAAKRLISVVLPKCEHATGCDRFATTGLNGYSCDDHVLDKLLSVPPEHAKQYDVLYAAELRKYLDLILSLIHI